MNKNQWIAISVALAAVILFVGYSYFSNNNQLPFLNMNNQSNEDNASTTSFDTASSTGGELGIKDVVVGTGDAAVAGDTVIVNYTGTFTDGTKFDSSYDHGQPFSFILGAGQVIAGWDLGVAGMKVGGKRDLVIPPELGYGNTANGPIPANSTLLFEIELMNVQHSNQ